MELTELCESFGVLPNAGGLLDQDYYYVVLLRAGLRAKRQLEAKLIKDRERKAKSGR